MPRGFGVGFTEELCHVVRGSGIWKMPSLRKTRPVSDFCSRVIGGSPKYGSHCFSSSCLNSHDVLCVQIPVTNPYGTKTLENPYSGYHGPSSKVH